MKKIVILFASIVIVGIAVASTYVLLGNKLNKNIKASNDVASSKEESFAVFETKDFKVAYPRWKEIDTKSVADADKIKVAVATSSCSLFVKEKELPDGLTLSTYTDKVIKDLGDRITVLKKEVSEDKATLDADILIDGTISIHNVSRVFLIGKTIYSIAFISEKSTYDANCGPVVDRVIESAVNKTK